MQSQIDLSFSNAFSMKTITDRKWTASASFLVSGDLTNPETLQHRPLTHGTILRSQTQRSEQHGVCSIGQSWGFGWRNRSKAWVRLLNSNARQAELDKVKLSNAKRGVTSVITRSTTWATVTIITSARCVVWSVPYGSKLGPWSDGADVWHWPSHQLRLHLALEALCAHLPSN